MYIYVCDCCLDLPVFGVRARRSGRPDNLRTSADRFQPHAG